MIRGIGAWGLWQVVGRDRKSSGTAARMCASIGGDRRNFCSCYTHRLLTLDQICRVVTVYMWWNFDCNVCFIFVGALASTTYYVVLPLLVAASTCHGIDIEMVTRRRHSPLGKRLQCRWSQQRWLCGRIPSLQHRSRPGRARVCMGHCGTTNFGPRASACSSWLYIYCGQGWK